MTSTSERTWEIADIDGRNKRTVTLAQYRAEIEAAKVVADAAWRESVASMRKPEAR